MSNAPYADYALLFAVADADLVRQRKGGITAFMVEHQGRRLRGGVRHSHHRSPGSGGRLCDGGRPEGDRRQRRRRKVNDGFKVAMAGINMGRIVNGARCLGFGRSGPSSKRWTAPKERVTFGVPLAQHEAIQFMLADCAEIEIACGRALGLRAAWKAATPAAPPQGRVHGQGLLRGGQWEDHRHGHPDPRWDGRGQRDEAGKDAKFVRQECETPTAARRCKERTIAQPILRGDLEPIAGPERLGPLEDGCLE